jgi:flagellar motility protein MotE (MotC chaperone)
LEKIKKCNLIFLSNFNEEGIDWGLLQNEREVIMMSQSNRVQSIHTTTSANTPNNKIKPEPAKSSSKTSTKKKSSGIRWFVALICIGAAGAAVFFLVPSVKNTVLHAVENVAGIQATPPVASANPVSQAHSPSTVSSQAQQTVQSQTTTPTTSAIPAVQSTNHIAAAKDIAKTYANMPPSKAAAALAQLSDLEIVYAMTEMSTEQRALIWSKMDPDRVADLSVQMTPRNSATDHELALIQRQIKKQNSNIANQSVKELVHTFSKMSSPSAARLIQKLFQTDSAKTIEVLKKMDVNTRASILTVMSGDSVMMDTAKQISQSFLK